MSSATILVTGGAGHLGANLVRRLLRDAPAGRVTIRAIAQPGANNAGLDGLPVERVEVDLRDRDGIFRAMAGIERVYHCAAMIATLPGGEQEIFDCNVMGTLHVLEAAKAAGVAKVVVSGSLSATGWEEGKPSNEYLPFNPFKRCLPYTWTKSLTELECWKAAANGLDVVVATSCAILGPNDYVPSRMGRTLLDYTHGRLRAYLPGGFEFVAARDIAEGHVLAMDKGRSGQKYIFGSGHTTVDELMEVFEEVTGVKKPKLRLPVKVMYGIAQVVSPTMTLLMPDKPQRFTPDAVMLLQQYRSADCTKAKTELGYRPTSVRQAIADAYEDFARRGLVPARPRPASIPRSEPGVAA